MLSLINTLKQKKSYATLKPSIDQYYNIFSHIENIPGPLDDAILSTSRFDLSGIGLVYDSHYESLNANYELCKDSVERILLVTTRVGVLEAIDIDISLPLQELFDYMRKITDIDLDWDSILESISTINGELTMLNSALDKSTQEAHVLLYNIKFILDQIDKLVKFIGDNLDGMAEVLDLLIKYKGLLEFLYSSKDSKLSDLPRLQEEISLL